MLALRHNLGRTLKLFAALALTGLLAACAGTAAVENRDTEAGQSLVFAATQDQTVAAAKTTLSNQGLNLTGESTSGNTTTILFSKPVSALSWGEVGRVLVTPVSENRTQATVTTQRRGALNVTAKSENTFAKEIFAGMSAILN